MKKINNNKKYLFITFAFLIFSKNITHTMSALKKIVNLFTKIALKNRSISNAKGIYFSQNNNFPKNFTSKQSNISHTEYTDKKNLNFQDKTLLDIKNYWVIPPLKNTPTFYPYLANRTAYKKFTPFLYKKISQAYSNCYRKNIMFSEEYNKKIAYIGTEEIFTQEFKNGISDIHNHRELKHSERLDIIWNELLYPIANDFYKTYIFPSYGHKHLLTQNQFLEILKKQALNNFNEY